MGFFTSETFNSLDEFLKHQVKDLYDAEYRMQETFDKMADKAHAAHLKQAFGKIAGSSEEQRRRLEEVFTGFGWEKERVTCEATKGLVKEADEVLDADGDHDVLDSALIAHANRLLHYKIAGYGSSRCQAKALDKDHLSGLLDEACKMAITQDEHLVDLALTSVNAKATV